MCWFAFTALMCSNFEHCLDSVWTIVLRGTLFRLPHVLLTYLAPSWVRGFNGRKASWLDKEACLGEITRYCAVHCKRTSRISVSGVEELSIWEPWSPLCRKWKRETFWCVGQAGGLWQNVVRRRILWRGHLWFCLLMQSLPWPWTSGRTFKNKDLGETRDTGLIKYLDSEGFK